ncbi:MAG: ParB N-terminal domain-containing protein, partial [Nitrososphaeraceae archaeon]
MNISDVKADKYASEVFPLTADQYEELKESIRQRGFLPCYPIVINEKGDVLDGHHRLRACQELGIEPRFEVKKKSSDDNNELEEKLFVIDSNLARRQLTRFQAAELVLRKKKPLLVELAKLNMSAGGSKKKGSLNRETLH